MRFPAFVRFVAPVLALFVSACGGGDWFWEGGGGGGGGGGDEGGGGGSTADATLSALVASSGDLSPGFAPGTLAYLVTVDMTVDSASVIPTAADPNADVSVDGFPLGTGDGSPPKALDTGIPVPFDVQVVAADGVTERHYTVVVLRVALAQEAYLKRIDDSASTTAFGQAVAVSGNTLMVGSPSESAVHVFERVDGSWTVVGRIVGSNTEADDGFGTAVAMSGDTAVVGAPYEDGSGAGVDPPDDEDGGGSGAAYVFVRDGSGWSQQALLKAGNSTSGQQFGGSVSVDGDSVAVGSVYEQGAGAGVDPAPGGYVPESGAAYVFVRQDGAWSQQAYVKPPVSIAYIDFGASVAISGDRLAVGAPLEKGPPPFPIAPEYDLVGAVYLLSRTAGTWTHESRLQIDSSSDLVSYGFYLRFGTAVALSGDTLVVGMPGDHTIGSGVDPDHGGWEEDQGAALVFVRESGAWVEDAYLKATWPSASLHFGSSVAIHGDVVVVGGPGEDGGGTGVDSPGGSWSPDAGAAYVFVRRDGVWTSEAYLKASNTDSYDRFGTSVAVSDGTIVVGAVKEAGSGVGVDPPDDDDLPFAGAAYVFR
jgi:hypothetical protein